MPTDAPSADPTEQVTQNDLIDEESEEDEEAAGLSDHDKMVYGIAAGAGGCVFIAIIVGAVVMKKRNSKPLAAAADDGMRFTGNPLFNPRVSKGSFPKREKQKKHMRDDEPQI